MSRFAGCHISSSLRRTKMSSKRIGLSLIYGVAVASTAGMAMGAPITVDSVGVLDPNPNNLTIADSAGNTSLGLNGVTLANFKTLITAAFASNTGGVLDFQESFQGGTWPNNPVASPNTGVAVGNGSANAVTATYGTSQTSTMSFFRNSTTDGFDANINQGTNVISGGGSTRTGSGTALEDFTTSPPTASPGPAGGSIIAAGGGYLGFTAANPELDFNNGLAAFGITALPRGASRHTQITLTLSDNSTTIVGTNDLVTTSAVFYGFASRPHSSHQACRSRKLRLRKQMAKIAMTILRSSPCPNQLRFASLVWAASPFCAAALGSHEGQLSSC